MVIYKRVTRMQWFGCSLEDHLWSEVVQSGDVNGPSASSQPAASCSDVVPVTASDTALLSDVLRPGMVNIAKAHVRHVTMSSNFIAQLCCSAKLPIGNCQFSIGKQSPNKRGF